MSTLRVVVVGGDSLGRFERIQLQNERTLDVVVAFSTNTLPGFTRGESAPHIVLIDLADASAAEAVCEHLQQAAPATLRFCVEVAREVHQCCHRVIPGGRSRNLAQLLVELQRSLGRFATPEALRWLREAPEIATPPTLVRRMVRLMADPGFTLGVLIDLLEGEPRHTMEVLRLAQRTGALHGHRPSTLEEAVRLLGAEAVLGLTAALEIDEMAALLPRELGWVGAQARLVGELAMDAGCCPRPAEAFAAGMAHNLGLLGIATARPDMASSLGKLECGRSPAERMLLGCTHGELGGLLAAAWGLPSALTQAIAWHHSPRLVGRGERLEVLAAVHLGVVAATETPLDRDWLLRSGFSAEGLPELRERARLRGLASVPCSEECEVVRPPDRPASPGSEGGAVVVTLLLEALRSGLVGLDAFGSLEWMQDAQALSKVLHRDAEWVVPAAIVLELLERLGVDAEGIARVADHLRERPDGMLLGFALSNALEEAPVGRPLDRALHALRQLHAYRALGIDRALAIEQLDGFADYPEEVAEALMGARDEGGVAIRVAREDLQPGMTLAQEVRNPRGHVLAEAGTEITRANVAALIRLGADETLLVYRS